MFALPVLLANLLKPLNRPLDYVTIDCISLDNGIEADPITIARVDGEGFINGWRLIFDNLALALIFILLPRQSAKTPISLRLPLAPPSENTSARSQTALPISDRTPAPAAPR